jgi:hypothetical protein
MTLLPFSTTQLKPLPVQSQPSESARQRPQPSIPGRGAIRYKPMQSTSRAGTRTPRPTFRRVPTHTEARVRMHRLAVVTMRIRPPSTLSSKLAQSTPTLYQSQAENNKEETQSPQQQRLVHDRLLVSLKLTLYRHATRRSGQSHQRRSFTATKARIRSHA